MSLKRFGMPLGLLIVSLKKGHTVRAFLVNKGIEAEDIKSERFPQSRIWQPLKKGGC